jgi:hypothetical protein
LIIKKLCKLSKIQKRLLIAGAVLAAMLLVWWFNTFTLKTTTVTIADPRIGNEITIVHLTDLHGAAFGRDNRRLLSRIERINPDVVLITGDMSTRGGNERSTEIALHLLRRLSERYPVFVVCGGHDEYIRDAIAIDGINATYLDYESTAFTVGDTTIHIHGVPNRFFETHGESDYLRERFGNGADPSVYNVLIAHEARFRAYRDFGADLSLCGHTHGGIIRLPWVGAVYHRDASGQSGNNVWFPEARGFAHLKGLLECEESGSRIFISGGLGLHPIPARFFNRPEVAVIRLTPR